jgi:arabinan endo-1,5-alpha-L-arabinosidase
MSGGGTLLLRSEGPRIGPGHAGLLSYSGKDYLGYHFYDAEERGRAKLGIIPLSWTKDGWPMLNDDPKPN